MECLLFDSIRTHLPLFYLYHYHPTCHILSIIFLVHMIHHSTIQILLVQVHPITILILSDFIHPCSSLQHSLVHAVNGIGLSWFVYICSHYSHFLMVITIYRIQVFHEVVGKSFGLFVLQLCPQTTLSPCEYNIIINLFFRPLFHFPK